MGTNLLAANIRAAQEAYIATLTDDEKRNWPSNKIDGLLQAIYNEVEDWHSMKSIIRATRNTAQSIPHNTPTVVIYDTKDWDLNEEWNTTTGTFTAKEPGYYKINASYMYVLSGWAAGALASIMYLFKNGAAVSIPRYNYNAIAQTTYFQHKGTDVVYLDGVADYLQVIARQFRGSPTNLFNGFLYNYINIYKVG